METKEEKERPYWEDRNIADSKFIKKFLDKNCFIYLKKSIFLSFYSSSHIWELKAIIKDFDRYFLFVLIPVKKKTYSCMLTIDNVESIAAEENN